MAQISTVFLFSLHLRPTNGDILLNCTRNFFDMIRTHLGSPRGPSIRSGTFDFLQVGDNAYEGIPDHRDSASNTEALILCAGILSIYRCAISFERVFADPDSYGVWMTFNHRPPTSRQLGVLARAKGIHVPFLGFPYKSPLLPDVDLDARLAASLNSRAHPQVYHSRHRVGVLPKAECNAHSLVSMPTGIPADKLSSLVQHFSHV